MSIMNTNDNAVNRRASEAAAAFGALIRSRRKLLKLRQNQVALVTGVGRRFLIDLEAGKPSCQLGRSLLVAEAVGLTSAGVPGLGSLSSPDLPDLAEEEPDGQHTSVL
jgi:transcriptional regulator with XRE-family HTH domain